VRGNTVRIAEDIPEEKYGFTPTPETRSVAQLLAHIAAVSRIQTHIHQSKIDDLGKVNFGALIQEITAVEMQPRSKAELIELLRREGEKFASYLEGLSDVFLAERVATPNDPFPNKSRLEMLMSAEEHEMHHRGQLMLGLVPHFTRQMQERQAALAAEARH
jgi:uncharacterized damage-inducible protein DinB